MFENIRRAEDPAWRLLLEQQVMARLRRISAAMTIRSRRCAPMPPPLGRSLGRTPGWKATRWSCGFRSVSASRRPQAHVSPDGSEIALSSKPQPDGTLVKALARAWRWQRTLDDGVYTSVTEIAEAEGIGFPTIRPIDRAGGATLFAVRRDSARSALATAPRILAETIP
jgi:hypothetical protein